MAAESMEEDLLDDAFCKDLGELEDLDDDAEIALLGDSDDEGGSKQRHSAINQQHYGEEEIEYVDEDGNVVDIKDTENFEYVEIGQEDNFANSVDDSGNDDVLDLVVDQDLEFDDSAVQDFQNDSDVVTTATPAQPVRQEDSSTQRKQRHESSHRTPQRAPIVHPQQQEKQRNSQQQEKQRNSQQPEKQRNSQQPEKQRNFQQPEKQRNSQQPEKQRNSQQQEKQRNSQQPEKQRNSQQQEKQRNSQLQSSMTNSGRTRPKVQEKLPPANAPLSSYQPVSESANHKMFSQHGSGTADVKSYKQSHLESKLVSSESDDDDEEEEENSGRGRFRTERPNIIHLSNVKKRSNIPDSLDLVISVEEATRLEWSSRRPKRHEYGKGSMNEQDRHKERNRTRDAARSSSKERRSDGNYKDNATASARPPPAAHLNLDVNYVSPANTAGGHSGAMGHTGAALIPSQDEGKGPRKILVNPHFFKGNAPVSSGANSSLWNSKPDGGSFPLEQCLNPFNNLFPSHNVRQPQHGTAYNSSFSTPAQHLPSQPLSTPVPPPEFQYGRPPVKPTSDFQTFQRPPSLMSTPSHLPLSNNLNSSSLGRPPLTAFPPPRDQLPPNLHYSENKSREMVPGQQYQPSSSSVPWNQHPAASIPGFKDFNASSGPVPPMNFPPASQPPLFSNPPDSQPLPHFSSLPRAPVPLFQPQLPPQNIRLPGPHGPFTTPPPNFNANTGLESQQLRPLDRGWPVQQTRPRIPIPMPPNFREPPPSFGAINHPPPRLQFQPDSSTQFNRNLVNVHGLSQESNSLQNMNQFSQVRMQTPTAFKQFNDNNYRHVSQKPNQHNPPPWVDKTIRPVKVNLLPRKRMLDDGLPVTSPLKQARLSAKFLQNKRKPAQVNSNIKQVQIVDQLPVLRVQPSANIDVVIKDEPKQRRPQPTSNSVTAEKTAIEDEEDEETRQYRLKIELQKKQREQILRLKEQRRVIMAHQRRKQMLAQQQQQQKLAQQQEQQQKLVQQQEPLKSDGLIPLPISADLANPVVKQVLPSNLRKKAIANVPAQSYEPAIPPNSTPIEKKRVVVRRVPCVAHPGIRKLGALSSKGNLPLRSGVLVRQTMDQAGSNILAESDVGAVGKPVIKRCQNVPAVSQELKQHQLEKLPSEAAPKRIVRRIPKGIPNKVNQQDDLSSSDTPRKVITGVDVDNAQSHARVQILNKTANRGQTEAKLSGNQQTADGIMASNAASHRQVAFQEPGPRRIYNPNTQMVRIENLAASTGELQLRKMCQAVGPVEKNGGFIINHHINDLLN